MQSKKRLFTKLLFPAFFWLIIWELAAIAVNNSFLLPDISTTFKELLLLLCDSEFYISATYSFLRVICGIALGTVFGVIIAYFSHLSDLVYSTVSPIISIIRSTPVASFIIILWIMMSGDSLAIFVSFLMVFPIIWQNTLTGLTSIDKDLLEVARIFEFSSAKTLRLLKIPAVIRYVIPALITSVGLGWKAEIAAEIIAYTSKSIGYMINTSKMDFDTPKTFAITVIIIVFSLILEALTKALLRRTMKRYDNQ